MLDELFVQRVDRTMRNTKECFEEPKELRDAFLKRSVPNEQKLILNWIRILLNDSVEPILIGKKPLLNEDDVALRVSDTRVPAVAAAVIVMADVLSSMNGPPRKS